MASRKKTTETEKASIRATTRKVVPAKTKSAALKKATASPKQPAAIRPQANTVNPSAPSSRPATKRKSNEVREKLISVTPGGSKDTTFYELVFEVARQIPKGRVTSYGAIAACLGAKSSSRMVGWAMNGADKVTPKLPAHRVVNRNGMLSGKHHFGTPTRMQELLEKEGIKVKNDTVVDFKKLFWDPAEELI